MAEGQGANDKQTLEKVFDELKLLPMIKETICWELVVDTEKGSIELIPTQNNKPVTLTFEQDGMEFEVTF